MFCQGHQCYFMEHLPPCFSEEQRQGREMFLESVGILAKEEHSKGGKCSEGREMFREMVLIRWNTRILMVPEVWIIWDSYAKTLRGNRCPLPRYPAFWCRCFWKFPLIKIGGGVSLEFLVKIFPFVYPFKTGTFSPWFVPLDKGGNSEAEFPWYLIAPD